MHWQIYKNYTAKLLLTSTYVLSVKFSFNILSGLTLRASTVALPQSVILVAAPCGTDQPFCLQGLQPEGCVQVWREEA